jgi:hypothetical protein
MPYGSGAANKSMEANRALLAKRTKQKFSYATGKDETNQFQKEATPEQLQEIRDRMHKQKIQEQKKFIIITIIALIIVYFIATAIDWHWLFKNFKS